jgi:uncharacterized membrane protein YesL
MNTDKSDMMITCEVCSSSIEPTYEMYVLFRPHFQFVNLAGIVVTLILLVILGRLILCMSSTELIKQSLLSSLATMSFFILCSFVVNTLLVKEFKVISIKSTNLSMMTSAFMSIDGQKEEREQDT